MSLSSCRRPGAHALADLTGGAPGDRTQEAHPRTESPRVGAGEASGQASNEFDLSEFLSILWMAMPHGDWRGVKQADLSNNMMALCSEGESSGSKQCQRWGTFNVTV